MRDVAIDVFQVVGTGTANDNLIGQKSPRRTRRSVGAPGWVSQWLPILDYRGLCRVGRMSARNRWMRYSTEEVGRRNASRNIRIPPITIAESATLKSGQW